MLVAELAPGQSLRIEAPAADNFGDHVELSPASATKCLIADLSADEFTQRFVVAEQGRREALGRPVAAETTAAVASQRIGALGEEPARDPQKTETRPGKPKRR